jgi:hypothetical protein
VEVVLGDVAVRDQRQRDHAHRLLRVVRPVREREQPARHQLAELEAARHRPRAQPPHDPVDGEDRDARDDEREHGCDQRGHHDLAEQAVAVDRLGALRRQRRADDSSDQRVRRARRQPEVPRREVPDDRSDQPGEDDRRSDEVGVDDPLRDGRRDGERDERADEVQDRRERDGDPRRQRARRDRRRHDVRGVVEAVREVEGERGGHDDDQDDVAAHDVRSS